MGVIKLMTQDRPNLASLPKQWAQFAVARDGSQALIAGASNEAGFAALYERRLSARNLPTSFGR